MCACVDTCVCIAHYGSVGSPRSDHRCSPQFRVRYIPKVLGFPMKVNPCGPMVQSSITHHKHTLIDLVMILFQVLSGCGATPLLSQVPSRLHLQSDAKQLPQHGKQHQLHIIHLGCCDLKGSWARRILDVPWAITASNRALSVYHPLVGYSMSCMDYPMILISLNQQSTGLDMCM